jgi:PAS domain-containing protein
MTALNDTDRSLAPAKPGERPRPIRFCSRCGQPASEPAGQSRGIARERVCQLCGMGLMLRCSRDALPRASAAFLIVTYEGRVNAVSEAAEKFFGPEAELLGNPLLDVVTSPLGDDLLARTVGHAAHRACNPVVLPVRSRSDAGQVSTLAARVASCGPPRAALVTVEPTGFGRR